MLHKEIIPAVADYIRDLASSAASKKAISSALSTSFEENLTTRLSPLAEELCKLTTELDTAVHSRSSFSSALDEATYYRDVVIAKMIDVRRIADELEYRVGEKYWPYPTYGDLLFKI